MDGDGGPCLYQRRRQVKKRLGYVVPALRRVGARTHEQQHSDTSSQSLKAPLLFCVYFHEPGCNTFIIGFYTFETSL